MNNILKLHAEGRLIRNAWNDRDADGRERLCLYTALANNANARPDSCPASLAPKWIAKLMPSWDDNGTLEAWPAMVMRVGTLAPRFGELVGRRNNVALAGCLIAALNECQKHNPAAVDPVIALLQRVIEGKNIPTVEDFKASAASARASARAAARAAASASASARASAAAEAWDRITVAQLDAIEFALNMEI